VYTIGSQLTARYWLLVAVLTVQFVPHRKHTPSPYSRSIPVTGRGGLYGCEMLRIPHCLDTQFTDGSKFVSPTHRPCSAPQKHDYFYILRFCNLLTWNANCFRIKDIYRTLICSVDTTHTHRRIVMLKWISSAAS
jgi:hypothetical protein